jgi:hypothetical protein
MPIHKLVMEYVRMDNIQSSSTNVTAVQLEQLAQLYKRQQASELMTRTLDKLFLHEADVSRQQLRQLQADLADFERQYNRSSQEFYHQFQAGETDDRMDFIEWASLFQMANHLQERLQVLAGEV